MQFILPCLFSFIITVGLTPTFIQYFNNKKIGQTTREEGPTWHEVKTGTPTMGGTVFVFTIIVVSLISSFWLGYLNNQVWMLVLTIFLFGMIGFLDDYISIFKNRNEGLTPKQKFISQLLSSALVILIGIMTSLELSISFFSINMTSSFLIVIFATIWMTGFSNAVNLTDGLDGLASGLNIIAYLSYALLAYELGYKSVTLFALIVVFALFGFLKYNRLPAKIFMGDVGSLALGAGLAVMSLILNHPWSLLIIGMVFVIETASVILQVISFKTTGKRIFKMSPIHHHFEMIGWSEKQVVSRFWIAGIISSLIYWVFFN